MVDRIFRGALLVLLAAAVLMALVAPVSAAPSAARPYIVTVVDGVLPVEVAADVGVEVSFVYERLFNGFAADLDSAAVRALRGDSRVETVLVDREAAKDARPGITQQTSWGQDRMGLLESRTAKVDNVDQPLDVDVAVFDTGVASHVDLRVAGGVDCAGAGTYTDKQGHGTAVAGVVGAIDNEFGQVGMAPGARIWGVRVEDPRGKIRESYLLCGIEWLLDQDGAVRIANLSLGMSANIEGPCGRSKNGKIKDPLHAAMCAAYDAGITIVAAAGNDSKDAERQLPAAYPETVSVSAIVETDGLAGGLGPEPSCLPGERDDHLATFSNYGATIDFAAPGVCVPSLTLNDRYDLFNGTSFAAPHVAGAAALVLAREPDLSPEGVRARLLEVASDDPIFGDPDDVAEPRLHVADL